MLKLIGTSRLSTGNKTTIIEEVAKLLNLKPGDMVAYLITETGTIVIKNKLDIEITD